MAIDHFITGPQSDESIPPEFEPDFDWSTLEDEDDEPEYNTTAAFLRRDYERR